MCFVLFLCLYLSSSVVNDLCNRYLNLTSVFYGSVKEKIDPNNIYNFSHKKNWQFLDYIVTSVIIYIRSNRKQTEYMSKLQ